MTGAWLVSYVALWGVVVILCLLMVGMMRQLGLIYRQLGSRRTETSPQTAIPDPEDDGPNLGSLIVDFDGLPMVNSAAADQLAPAETDSALIVIMSPMCEICHRIVAPLNSLSEDLEGRVGTAVVIRGDIESCRAFLSVFPLRMPVFCDADSSVTMSLEVHRIPFGLMYERGLLVRKRPLDGHEDLLAVVGEASTVPASRTS